MKLTIEQIRAAACGAVYITEEEAGVLLHRFTKEQERIYSETSFREKSYSTPCVQLVFRTDSEYLILDTDVKPGSGRRYFGFDIEADGVLLGSLDNYSDLELPEDYTVVKGPLGQFCKRFALGEGEKTVRIHFPFSAAPYLREISLADGSSFVPVKREKKILMFGDSITHGYDALNPSRSYASRLADMLGMEAFNKGIGGERFFPPLAGAVEEFVPDIITVAYGTNDWSGCTAEEFIRNCTAFYNTLSKNYPDTPIYAVTPIWRADCEQPRKAGTFFKADEWITAITAPLPNVRLIHGFELVPHDRKLFADLRLHPTDEGFRYYAENLYRAIRAYGDI